MPELPPTQAQAGNGDLPDFPLVLIGPMAAGKTKVGKRVARVLGVPFVDTDALIVSGHGSVANLFSRYGEEHFRALERIAVGQALATRAVVSLGGGAVLDAGTRADLARCRVVYLSVTEQAVAGRINGGKRPLLANGLADWIRIYELRRPLYEELAGLHIDTSNRQMDSIADDVVAWIQRGQNTHD
ncbi:shikimate kinase [Cryobacterium algoricola]|uniref:Shikimate kinase n=1 Tax=Cryobacterium algoricola TaxID=1259183 RepID=A0ABY2IIC7_9MICO|nr:shikimate kinase [Cryobacterium algoricola]TFB90390.1 shikimate kinase [Cryobacterium algoricola]